MLHRFLTPLAAFPHAALGRCRARHARVRFDLSFPGFRARGPHAMRHAEFLLQRRELVQGQVPPLAGAQIFGGDAGMRDARKPHHERAGGFTEPPHLAIAPFAQGELEPSLVAFEAQPTNFGGRRRAAINLDALAPIEQLVVLHEALHFGDVYLLRLVARVSERVRKIPVVRAQECAARMEIQAAHRDHAHADGAQQLGDGRAPLWIAQRAHDTARLVQNDVYQRLRHQTIAIDLDFRPSRVDTNAQFVDHAAVDLHAALGDQLLCRAA
jgi:hypothetical protein